MLILFTSVGDTDPVRNYHDGAMLHIIRHYPVDKVILFMTKEMMKKEAEAGLYTKGIKRIKDISIEYIKSEITEPQNYEELSPLLTAFDNYYRDDTHKDAEWLVNISSGTPQMKTIMSIIGIDYPRVTAVQVTSPERGSNRKAPPCRDGEEGADMLEFNEDDAENAPNRCSEPSLNMIHRYGLRLQIESLVRNYEYNSALQIVNQHPSLFSENTQKLLQHGIYRILLKVKKANECMSYYDGQPLVRQSAEIMEYYRLMELDQKKGNISGFIIKLSPILMKLGEKYIQDVWNYPLKNIGVVTKEKGLVITEARLQKNEPGFLAYLNKQFHNKFGERVISFIILLYLSKYLSEVSICPNMSKENQGKVNRIFSQLRIVEEQVRNKVAHTMLNIDEDDLERLTIDKSVKGFGTKKILSDLREIIMIIYGKSITADYDLLNEYIIQSMKEI